MWPADIDTDGDLDLVLAPRDGHPLVLRNNGDGTFTARDPFAASRARAASPGPTWTAKACPTRPSWTRPGPSTCSSNLRGGDLPQPRHCPASYGHAVAIAAAEQSGDSLFDLLVLARDGAITRLSRNAAGGTWQGAALSRVELPSGTGSRALRACSPPISTTTAPPI